MALSVLLLLDLWLHRGGRETSRRAALVWTGIYVAAGLAFAIVVHLLPGARADEYLAAYAMEKSLSLDNMFVFLLIFRSLRIPDESQHTALAWGILGALVLRSVFIFVGASALERWDVLSYVFGAILFLAALHSLRDTPSAQGESRIVKLLSRHLPVVNAPSHNRFIVRTEAGRRATPLLLALIAIELSDVVFAVDSIPAALSVSRDRFVVFSSNAFALVGLRSLYLALHATLTNFRYLNYGLAGVLAFAAVKLVAGEYVHVEPLWSVAIIVGLLGASVVASLVGARLEQSRTPAEARQRISHY